MILGHSIFQAEIFQADKVTNSAGYTDADYTTADDGEELIDKSGQTNPVKWDATQGVYVTDRGDGFKALVTNATDAVKFRKGYMTKYYRNQGENFVFESFSPDEPKVVKPFMTQDQFDNVNTPDTPDTPDDSEDSDDDTDEDPMSSQVEPEKTNILLWVGIAGLAALALLAKR